MVPLEQLAAVMRTTTKDVQWNTSRFVGADGTTLTASATCYSQYSLDGRTEYRMKDWRDDILKQVMAEVGNGMVRELAAQLRRMADGIDPQ